MLFVRLAIVSAFAFLVAAPAPCAAHTAEPGDDVPPAAIDPDATGAPKASVPRAVFTTSVRELEPQDRIEVLDAETKGSVMFFTELLGLNGRTVRHRWIYNGRVMAEIPFAVLSQRWRVYSSKTLPPGWTGEWTVVVVDEQDRILARKSFSYITPESTPANSRD
jgi:hypothetical protein